MKFTGILSVGLFLLANEVSALAGTKGLVAAADSAVISVEKLKRDFDIARKANLIKRTELTERDASAEAHGMAKRMHTLNVLNKRGFFGMTPATVDKRDKVIAVLKERDEATEEESTCCDFYLVSKRDTVRIRDEDSSTCCDFYLADKRDVPAAPEKRAEDDSTCCDFYLAEKRDVVATPEKRAEDESTCCDFYLVGRDATPEAVPEAAPAEDDSTCCDFYIPGQA